MYFVMLANNRVKIMMRYVIPVLIMMSIQGTTSLNTAYVDDDDDDGDSFA